MTYKALVYSDHAVERMAARGFRRADVRHLLATGVEQPTRTRPGGEIRHWKVGRVGGRAAAVVYVEDAHRILVITVEWWMDG